MKAIYNIAVRHCNDRVVATVDFDTRGADGTRCAVFEQKYENNSYSASLAQIALMDEIRDYAEGKS